MFWVLGIPSAALWGTLTAFTSVLPLVGATAVWVPCTLYLLLSGHWTTAVVLAVWGTLVISGVDNFVRPKLVGNRVGLSELVMFFALLGGLQVFGVLGIVLGQCSLPLPHRFWPCPAIGHGRGPRRKIANENGAIMPNTMLRGPVLVGTDVAAGAEEALRQGAQLARDLGTPLIACHVLPELLRVGMLFPQWRGVDPTLEPSMKSKAIDAVRRELRAVLGTASEGVQVVVDSGTAHVGLLAQADATGAGIIVTGPGDVADQVVRHASVPVLVARQSPRGVVVGATDFSAPSLPGLTAAAYEATRRGAPLHLIHAFDLGAFALGTVPVGAAPYLTGASAIALDGLEELRAVASRKLQDMLQQAGVDGETHVVDGRATTAIVEYAEQVGAELVVVGTHGRSGFARITLGSTAGGVIDSAPCSVLVVRVAGK